MWPKKQKSTLLRNGASLVQSWGDGKECQSSAGSFFQLPWEARLKIWLPKKERLFHSCRYVLCTLQFSSSLLGDTSHLWVCDVSLVDVKTSAFCWFRFPDIKLLVLSNFWVLLLAAPWLLVKLNSLLFMQLVSDVKTSPSMGHLKSCFGKQFVPKRPWPFQFVLYDSSPFLVNTLDHYGSMQNKSHHPLFSGDWGLEKDRPPACETVPVRLHAWSRSRCPFKTTICPHGN